MDLWSKNHSLSSGYCPWTRMVLDHKSLATGLLLLHTCTYIQIWYMQMYTCACTGVAPSLPPSLPHLAAFLHMMTGPSWQWSPTRITCLAPSTIGTMHSGSVAWGGREEGREGGREREREGGRDYFFVNIHVHVCTVYMTQYMYLLYTEVVHREWSHDHHMT